MKKILLAATVLALAVSGCKPKSYEVKREIVINAPLDLIIEQIDVIKNQEKWSPWERMDTNMTKTYSGPESGVGATYSWSGNDSVGVGSMELMSAHYPDSVIFKLTFTSPWEAVSDIFWVFNESDAGVNVVWGNRGSYPGYLFWMSEADMDAAMGKDFERGLKQLKALTEQLAADAKPDYKLQVTEVASVPMYSVTDEVSWSEINDAFFGSRYQEIGAYLAEDGANLSAPPMAIFHVWDEENKMAKVEVALACESKKPGTKRIVKGNSYGGSVVKASYYGPYEGTEPVHYAIEEFMKANALEMAGSPWESYVTDPATEPDPQKWLTEIFYPVKPLESAQQ